MTKANRRTEQLRYAMTPAEMIQAQLWIWNREASLRKPKGTRRRTDHPKAPLKVWRLQRGWSLAELARMVSLGKGRIGFETIRSLEDGTAERRLREQVHPRLAAVFGVPADLILIPRKE